VRDTLIKVLTGVGFAKGTYNIGRKLDAFGGQADLVLDMLLAMLGLFTTVVAMFDAKN
jgi:hypothetical protein